MTLSELKSGQFAIVDTVQTGRFGAGLATRLAAMGVTPGRSIRVLRAAWLGGPLEVQVGSTTVIAIRRTEAKQVLVSLES